MMFRGDGIAQAILDIEKGRPVVVVDDGDRDDEGDLVFAAAAATPELVAFAVRHTSGFVCTALPAQVADRLRLPPMTAVNQNVRGTDHAVTVDARDGVTTGISARDRARTIRLLADPGASPHSFARPGHVVPLRACPGGVLRRPGHTEAAVDLARLAGCAPVAALSRIVSPTDDRGMARLDELTVFAKDHDLRLITISDLVDHLRRTSPPKAPGDDPHHRRLGTLTCDCGRAGLLARPNYVAS
ncbi:3,4-dihydroxy-2-butanone-4-phosphate synthase [Prauserella flavalba]|uniref:3,4-dihydroxy-2-butanone 4-phosphate synthase n=1 Tax=Prauserella flavalba TaxID=1477506 RepID=A0A318LIK3_9PSEU|nr:3,4-dihydroxy-2-butanone-4-phosphate synthase [Prauserella flavalba]